MATPVVVTPDYTKPATYVGALTALAAIVAAFFPALHVAAFILAAATGVTALVTVVGIVRGKGPLLSRLVSVLETLAQLIPEIISVLPKAAEKKAVEKDPNLVGTYLEDLASPAQRQAITETFGTPGPVSVAPESKPIAVVADGATPVTANSDQAVGPELDTTGQSDAQ